jgi:hypothetical protein
MVDNPIEWKGPIGLHGRTVLDGMNRMSHYEEYGENGKLIQVTNIAYFSDGSSITTKYDFSTSPATVTLTRNP